jgi:hypothetical protein
MPCTAPGPDTVSSTPGTPVRNPEAAAAYPAACRIQSILLEISVNLGKKGERRTQGKTTSKRSSCWARMGRKARNAESQRRYLFVAEANVSDAHSLFAVQL